MGLVKILKKIWMVGDDEFYARHNARQVAHDEKDTLTMEERERIAKANGAAGIGENKYDIQTDGVKNMEAITSVWSKRGLYLGWIAILLLSTAICFDANTVYTFQAYGLSTLNGYSYSAAIGAVQNVLYAVTKPFMAKLNDTFGRFQAFLISILVISLGFIIVAASDTISAFFVAQIFYVFGQVGIQFNEQLFAADTTSLPYRSLFIILPQTPYIYTSWIGSIISSAMLVSPGWRWGYGMFAIIVPGCGIPILVLLGYHEYKAKRLGLVKGRNWRDLFRIWNEFDVIGLILLTAGIVLVILPLQLTAGTSNWHKPYVPGCLVVGGVCWIAWIPWELYFAKIPIVPIHLFKNWNLFWGCCILFFYFMAFYCFNTYFYSWLVISQNLSYKAANNISVVFTVSSTTTAFFASFLIRYVRRYKPFMMFGVIMYLVGSALLYRYRHLNTHVYQLVITQAVIGFGGGLISTPTQVSVQAVVTHQQVAAATALLLTFNSIGGAVGNCISGSLYRSNMVKYLLIHLPAENRDLADILANSITTAVTYPMGSEIRTAANLAYNDVMRILMIATMAVIAPMIFMVWMIHDVDLARINQHVKGVVIGGTFNTSENSSTTTFNNNVNEKENYSPKINEISRSNSPVDSINGTNHLNEKNDFPSDYDRKHV